jgi:hypothetical protein
VNSLVIKKFHLPSKNSAEQPKTNLNTYEKSGVMKGWFFVWEKQMQIYSNSKFVRSKIRFDSSSTGLLYEHGWLWL